VTILGRGAAADIRFESHQVSRRHVRIECAGGRCEVSDLQSSNGTFVNDQRVSKAVLSPGDRLRLGDVKLVYRPADTQPSRAWLDISGMRYPVPDGGLTIGRSSDSGLHLPDEVVSRRHARIELQGGALMLVNLNSANGTFVNGRRIEEQPLRDGDEIRIGRNRLVFHTEERM
jgi:pSer/pThr/pTyr-binding forkhead associated (FHA) protein